MIDETIIEKGLTRLLTPDAVDGTCGEAFYRYAADDMVDDERAKFEAHLARCKICTDALAAVSDVETPLSVGRSKRRWRNNSIIAASVAAMLTLTVVSQVDLFTTSPVDKTHTPVFRPKSGYRMQLAVERNGRQFAAKSGDSFETGDLLGFFYTAPSDTWPVILYSDNKGEIMRIFPPKVPIRVPAGVERSLPVSAVLEAGDGCEWIAAVFFEKSPKLKKLESAFKHSVRGRQGECGPVDIVVQEASTEVFTLKRGNPEK